MRPKVIILLLAIIFYSEITHSQQNYFIEPSPWSFSWGVGLGAMSPSGSLGNNFDAGFAADTEINIYYKKAFLMINGGFSYNSLARDIPVVMLDDGSETTWPSGSNALHAFIGGNIGVNILESGNISLYPFAGIGYGFIEPNLKTANSDPILSALKINSFLWNVGIGVDYSYNDNEYAPGKINRIRKVGLRYQYQKPNYEKDILDFEGATHWVTLRFEIGTTI